MRLLRFKAKSFFTLKGGVAYVHSEGRSARGLSSSDASPTNFHLICGASGVSKDSREERDFRALVCSLSGRFDDTRVLPWNVGDEGGI